MTRHTTYFSPGTRYVTRRKRTWYGRKYWFVWDAKEQKVLAKRFGPFAEERTESRRRSLAMGEVMREQNKRYDLDWGE